MILNVMLGTGPIIVPEVFLKGGLVLSTFFTLLIGSISLVSGLFVVEALSIANGLVQSEKVQRLDTETLSENYHQINTQKDSSDTFLLSKFKIDSLFEYGTLAEIFIGFKGKLLVSTAIIFYLFGVIISKIIMSGNILSKVFHNVHVLKEFDFWIILFFGICALLSFKDVSSIKFIQIFCGVIRFICIMLFLFGPIYVILKNQNIYPFEFSYNYGDRTVDFKLIDLSNFPYLFSNLTFAFTV
jgi:amino acid permease